MQSKEGQRKGETERLPPGETETIDRVREMEAGGMKASAEGFWSLASEEEALRCTLRYVYSCFLLWHRNAKARHATEASKTLAIFSIFLAIFASLFSSALTIIKLRSCGSTMGINNGIKSLLNFDLGPLYT